jgi:hypothetical protein
MDTKLFYQSVLLGIVTVLIGLILSVIFGSLKPELPRECELWDKYYVMEMILFFVGVSIRIFLTTDLGCQYLLN